MSNNITHNLTTQQAIDQALQAERDSLGVITECEAETKRIVSQARKVAHRIAEHADDRISLAHRRCKQATEKAIKQLQASEVTSANNHQQHTDSEHVQRVVSRLAESLTGKPPA